MKKDCVYLVLLCVLWSCASSKNKIESDKKEQTNSKQVSLTAPIIEKPFYNKVGEKMDFNEYYLQQSVQDYFIKFCESKVTKDELENTLSTIDGPIKSLKVKVEFREGAWDTCDGEHSQSRTGRYVVLLEI